MRARLEGFTYLTVLFAIAFMGLGLALAGEAWHTALMREREAQLLYTGNQYRRAIERYYLSGLNQFPRTLEDLLKDPRKPQTGAFSFSKDPALARATFEMADAAARGKFLSERKISTHIRTPRLSNVFCFPQSCPTMIRRIGTVAQKRSSLAPSKWMNA